MPPKDVTPRVAQSLPAAAIEVPRSGHDVRERANWLAASWTAVPSPGVVTAGTLLRFLFHLVQVLAVPEDVWNRSPEHSGEVTPNKKDEQRRLTSDSRIRRLFEDQPL
jgi:hypothetical protein